MKTKVFLVAIFFSQIALSQTIYKSSIDNGGASVSVANLYMVYTIGEVNVQEVTAGNISISEGFIGPIRRLYTNIDFTSGWNWFSVNMLNDDMSLENLLTCASEGDFIKDQLISARYYEGIGWFGNLATQGLDPLSTYKIKVANPCQVSYSGAPVDVLSSPIDIVAGWNWIGYLPQCPLPLIPDNEALASLILEEGDHIKDQLESATFYEGGIGWFGFLDVMEPNGGYLLKKQSADQLFYPLCPPVEAGSKKSARSERKILGASLDPHQFEFNGTVTATVYVDGVLAGGEGDLIMAYVNDQLRGVSNGLYFEPDGAYVYPLMVYSNLVEGESINFRYYDKESGQTFACDETLDFSEDMIVDNAFESFELHVNSAVGLHDQKVADGLSLDVYPNPFNDLLQIEYSLSERSKVRIEVIDMLGKVIEILDEKTLDPGDYMTGWNAQPYPEATYILKLSTENTSLMSRIILIR